MNRQRTDTILRRALSVALDADPGHPMIDSVENWTAYADEPGHEDIRRAMRRALAGNGPQRALCTDRLMGTIADLGVIEMEAA